MVSLERRIKKIKGTFLQVFEVYSHCDGHHNISEIEQLRTSSAVATSPIKKMCFMNFSNTGVLQLNVLCPADYRTVTTTRRELESPKVTQLRAKSHGKAEPPGRSNVFQRRCTNKILILMRFLEILLQP